MMTCLIISTFTTRAPAQTDSRIEPSARLLRQVVIAAFAETHDGWSSDEIILNDQLNQLFISACQKELPKTTQRDFNWTLLNLRKAGLLTIKATKRKQVNTSDVAPIAEMACRSIQDQHTVSIDEMMANPKLKSAFNKRVKEIDAKVDPRFRPEIASKKDHGPPRLRIRADR